MGGNGGNYTTEPTYVVGGCKYRPPDMRMTVVVIKDHLRVINQNGERHGVIASFNGEMVRVGCVELAEDAWVKLKQQVDEAIVMGKKNIARLNAEVKKKR